jgi:hypothetical protein
MKYFCTFVLFAAFASAWNAETALAQTTFGSLLQEMTDRDNLAKMPASGEKYELRQASSHDPTATTLGAPDNFANYDYNRFLGSQTVNGQVEYTMLSDTGAGAITRWWMTNMGGATGTIRVYVDGGSTPVLSGQITPLIGQSSNKFGPQLSFISSTDSPGANLYAPITYSKSIKVTYRQSAGSAAPAPGVFPAIFYNIDYRKYESGARVSSYTTASPTTYATQITTANAALATPVVTGNVSKHDTKAASLAAGQDVSYDLNGTGAIRQLKLNVTGADPVGALRNTYVELTFDGQKTVNVPAGEFFGNGDGTASQPYNASQDYYRTVSSDGTMASRWTMPYQNAAKVRLVNKGTQRVNVSLQVDSGSWTWDNNSMYFHANYREEDGIKTRGAEGTGDFRMLTVRGKGVYVGDTLSVRNGGNRWWGEGDEKVYVDYINANGNGSSATPTHLGTGTEDYYGYANGTSGAFHSAFVSQPIGTGNDAANQRTVDSRVRALDAIPFTSSFKHNMEMWHWDPTTVDYGATAYWYGAPGASAMHVAADLAADYQTNHDFSTGGLTDTAGDGHWTYLSSSAANALGPNAKKSLLTYGQVGNASNSGYGGGQNGYNLAAISNQYIFVDGDDNDGVQGAPGYHELSLHPGGAVEEPYTVARWIAGASSVGTANINGSVRNLIANGDGVDFWIYVNGLLQFSAAGNGATLPETYFDFDVALSQGSVVDFVLGNHGSGSFAGDESLLRATIMVVDVVPEPSSLALLGTMGICVLTHTWMKTRWAHRSLAKRQ